MQDLNTQNEITNTNELKWKSSVGIYKRGIEIRKHIDFVVMVERYR